MDPDRWEFANEWFLRGQKHLLKNIVRKKHVGGVGGRNNHDYNNCNLFYQQGNKVVEDLDDDEAMVTEIAKLKEEQKALEEEIQGMNKRLETTEKRPQQMMAFLCNVVEDPQVLSRILLEREKKQQNHHLAVEEKKKRRLMPSVTVSATAATSSSSSSGMAVKTEFEEDDEATFANNNNNMMSSSSPETGFEIDDLRRVPSSAAAGWWGQGQIGGLGYGYNYGYDRVVAPTPLTVVSPADVAAPLGYENNSDGGAGGGGKVGRVSLFSEMAAENNKSSLPPYPFSLLGGSF